MTPAEINEAVARKLHGDDWRMWIAEDYCGSIAAAWEIVEKVSEGNPILGKGPDGGNSWRFSFWEGSVYVADAETAPLAICLAFLKVPC